MVPGEEVPEKDQIRAFGYISNQIASLICRVGQDSSCNLFCNVKYLGTGGRCVDGICTCSGFTNATTVATNTTTASG